MVVVGTRPEAIKMAPVVKALRQRSAEFDCTLVSTGQHREMLHQAISGFGLEIDIDLELMQPNQTLAGLTAAAIEAGDRLLREVKPSVVLVQGDTTTVLALSLAAHYSQIPVGHIEAGLRTHERYNPFPEEMNRSLLGPLASMHFAPTQHAAQNLINEGVSQNDIYVTGNTVVDALETLRAQLDGESVSRSVREAVAASSGRFILVTCHRRESFGGDLKTIVAALKTLAQNYPDRLFFFPVHLNPNLREQVLPRLRGVENIVLSDPVGYLDLLYCLSNAELVLTDSGGIQEEAPSFAAPTIILRRTTERPEGIAAGFSKLAPLEHDAIVDLATDWLTQSPKAALLKKTNPFGDGKAAIRIVDILAGKLIK